MEENLGQGSDGPSFAEEGVEPPSRKASFRVRAPRMNMSECVSCLNVRVTGLCIPSECAS